MDGKNHQICRDVSYTEDAGVRRHRGGMDRRQRERIERKKRDRENR